jgi:tripartite-type tricarboxylate transporter receptor subunit TctC
MSQLTGTAFTRVRPRVWLSITGLVLLAVACAPAAAPAPTKPAVQPTAAPAKTEAKPAEAAKPAVTAAPAKPVDAPAKAEPAAKPAASPVEKPAAKEAPAKPAGPAYFQGKTINLIIGTTPGSVFDTRARIITRHLGRHVAGSPSVVPQNMGGGGGLGAMNHLYNVAPRDGTNMVMSTGGIYLRHIFGLEGIQHKLEEMVPIYNPEGDGAIIFAGAKLGLKEPRDIAKVTQRIHYGVSTPEGNSVLLGIAGFTLLGLQVNPVGGYPGSAEIRLAVERGELDAGWEQANGYTTTLKPQFDSGVFTPIFQSGLWRPRDNAIIKPEGLEHIPTFQELHQAVKGTSPSGPLWDAWLLPLISYGRGTVFLPPGVPEQAVRDLRAGFEAMCKDEQFIADQVKLNMDPKCYLGDEAKLITERSSKGDPKAVEALNAIRPKSG